MKQLLFLLPLWFSLAGHPVLGQAVPPAIPYPAPPRESDMLIISNVNVVDVETEEVEPNQMVVMRGGVIISVGKWVPAGRGIPRFDGKGRYLVPGLWDGRTSALGTPATERVALPLYVASGITSIRDVSSPRSADLAGATYQEVVHGQRIGPRLELAGGVLDGPPAGPLARTATRAQGLAQATKLMQEDCWTRLQVGPQLSREAYFGAAVAAHDANVPLIGQVPETVTMQEALAAGQRGYDYLDKLLLGCSTQEDALVKARAASLLGPHPATHLASCIRAQRPVIAASFSLARCTELARALVKAHAFVVPVLATQSADTPAEPVADSLLRYVPAATRQQWAAMTARKRQLSPLALAQVRTLDSLKRVMLTEFQGQGVRIIAGSDAGAGHPDLFYGASLVTELEALVASGLTPAQALRTATANPAIATGHCFELGGIEAGYLADLVLLAANPLDDIRNVRRVEAVLLRGRLFDRPALTALAAEAAQAAQPSSGKTTAVIH